MHVKRFKGQTISEALATARRELGEETVVLGVRKLGTSERNDTEVTVAVERSAPARPAPAAVPPPAASVPAASVPLTAPRGVASADSWIGAMEARFDLLSQRVRSLSTALVEAPAPAGAPGAAVPDPAEAVERLTAVGLDPRLSQEGSRAAASAAPKGLDTYLSSLTRALSSFVPSGRRGGMPRVVALIGPPGVGKTTTAVHLAARSSVHSGDGVVLVDADDYRIGAGEPLREYGDLLGVPVERVRDLRGFQATLARHREARQIIVDTAGISARDDERLLGLSALLDSAPECEAWLVLPATRRRRDLEDAILRFRGVGIRRVVFTRLDETRCYGEALSAVAATAAPLAGLSFGQRVPDDYQETSGEALAEAVVRSAWPETGRNA